MRPHCWAPRSGPQSSRLLPSAQWPNGAEGASPAVGDDVTEAACSECHFTVREHRWVARQLCGDRMLRATVPRTHRAGRNHPLWMTCGRPPPSTVPGTLPTIGEGLRGGLGAGIRAGRISAVACRSPSPGRPLQAMFRARGRRRPLGQQGRCGDEAAGMKESKMSNETSTGRRHPPWASGSILFAAGMLVITGVLQVFVGTTALTVDRIYDGTPQYLYAFDLHDVGLGPTAHGHLVRGSWSRSPPGLDMGTGGGDFPRCSQRPPCRAPRTTRSGRCWSSPSMY